MPPIMVSHSFGQGVGQCEGIADEAPDRDFVGMPRLTVSRQLAFKDSRIHKEITVIGRLCMGKKSEQEPNYAIIFSIILVKL